MYNIEENYEQTQKIYIETLTEANALGSWTSSPELAKRVNFTIIKEWQEIEKAYNGVYYLKGYAPKQPIEELQTIKKTEIKQAFETVSASGYTVSSLGFRVDATSISLTDVQGLMRLVNSGHVTVPVMFRDYDNAFHEVSLEDLSTLEMEITAHGVTVYAEKWALEKQVNSAETVEAVQAVDAHSMSGYDWEPSPDA